MTAPLGDDAAWFWSWDCASNCDRAMAGYELEVWYGKEADGESLPYELGAGVAGLAFPFVQGYLQLRDGDRPLGIGARIGVPLLGWHEHQIMLRYDVPLRGGGRILIDPAVFLHSVNSPNGENPGLFLGLVPAVGLEIPFGSVAFIPSVALVGGWVRRDSYGVTTSSFALFPSLSLGIAPGQGPP